MWLSCARPIPLHNMETIITAALRNRMFLRTRASSSEVKIKPHQITVANVVQVGHRGSPRVDNMGILLCPGKTRARAHNRVPAIAHGPGVEIPGVAGNAWVCLPGHAGQLIFSEYDHTRIGIVVSFDKSTIPGGSCGPERQQCRLVGPNRIAKKYIV